MTLDGLDRHRPDDRDVLADEQARELAAIERLEFSDVEPDELERLLDCASRLALTPLSAVDRGPSS